MLGTEVMERILALQTPLQQITVGSGIRLKTQTWGETQVRLCNTYLSVFASTLLQ